MSRKRRSYQLDFDDVVQRAPGKVFIRQNGQPKRVPEIIVIDDDEQTDMKVKNCSMALSFLKQSHWPSFVHGRQQEYLHITNFVEEALKNGANHPLVLSGLPGYGKTLVLKDCLRRLNSLSSFKYLYFNCKNIKSLEQMYQALSKNIQIPQQCLIEGPWVLVLDEIDSYPAQVKIEQLLYNLLQLNINTPSNIIMILVSNRVNFKSTFQPKMQSRLGFSQILFKPYNAQQLTEIIRQRTNLIPQGILKYAVHKFSIKSSDIRSLLKFCCEIVKNYRKSPKINVTLEDVNYADLKIFGNVTANSLVSLQFIQKILLIAIYTEDKLRQPAMLTRCYDRALAKGYSDQSWHNTIRRAKILQSMNLIKISCQRHLQEDYIVSGNLYESELVEAFLDDGLLKPMIEFMVQAQKL